MFLPMPGGTDTSIAMDRIPHGRRRCLTGCVGSWALLLLTFFGCNTPPAAKTYNRDLPPTLDRLIAAYEDLSSKRFEIIADFESPEQGGIFRVEPAGAAGQVKVSAERARSETGVGSLKMTFVDSRQ